MPEINKLKINFKNTLKYNHGKDLRKFCLFMLT